MSKYMRKNKKFSKTDKAIYRLGYLEHLSKAQAEINTLKRRVQVFRAACHEMAKEIKRLDQKDDGVFISIAYARKFMGTFGLLKKYDLQRYLRIKIKERLDFNPELLRTLHEMKRKDK